MSETWYAFIIGGEKPVVLHPFDTDSSLYDHPEQAVLSGRCGTGRAILDADAIRATFYKEIEAGYRRHLLDKGFLLRVATSLGLFVAVYLFFSLVIRDPIPVVDELFLGGAAAFASFAAMERKTLISRGFSEALVDLRRTVDGSMFLESQVVDLVVAWRDEAQDLGPAAFYRRVSGVESLSEDQKDEASALCAIFARRWKNKPIVAELYKTFASGQAPGKLLDSLFRSLGPDEGALALAYLRLLPLVLEPVR